MTSHGDAAGNVEALVGATPLVALRRLADGCRRNSVVARLEGAEIVCIVCDRGDRYLSTGGFPA